MSYKAYLQTDHWQEFRSYALENLGRVCVDCGATDVRFEVHHLTYENIWEEQLEDVIILCHSCHMKRHPEKFRHKCKHKNLIKTHLEGRGTVIFYWHCTDCNSIICEREPDKKEIIFAKKVAEKYVLWLEKEKIKEVERETKRREKEALAQGKAKSNPKRVKNSKKKPKSKSKYRNPYKNKEAYRRSRLKAVNE